MIPEGMGVERFSTTVAEISHGIEQGLHPGAQVYLSQRGRTLADFALGTARPGLPMTPESRTCWLSAGKPLTVVLCLQLIEQKRLSLDDPLSALLPQWRESVEAPPLSGAAFSGDALYSAASFDPGSADGETTIRVRHLLTHTSGLPEGETGWPTQPWDNTISTIIQRVADARRGGKIAAPGTRGAYDRGAAWFLLGEMVRRITGQDFAVALRQNLLNPTAMTKTINGIPRGVASAAGRPEEDDVDAPDEDWADLATRQLGAKEQQWLGWNQPPYLSRSAPGGNTRGPARELGRFYEMLLRGGLAEDGTRLLSAESVKQMTTRHRSGMLDETFRHIVDFGLGLIINSARHGRDTVPYGFGPAASDSAFGHGGSQSSIAFADPERDLVVVAITNGMPGEPKHQARMRRILTALEADLEASR